MSTLESAYLPTPLEGFELCHPAREEDFDAIASSVDGTQWGRSWSSLEVKLVSTEADRELRFSDAPWMTAGCLVFGERAIERFGSLLRENGDLLPLCCQQRQVLAFLPRAVLPCIDETRSSVDRLESGRIFHIHRYVMRQEVLGGHQLYKADSLLVSPTFVGSRFVHAWREAGLAGLAFDEVWRGDRGEV